MYRIVMALAFGFWVVQGSVAAQDLENLESIKDSDKRKAELMALKAELMAGLKMLNIPGWSGPIHIDPFTDQCKGGFATAETSDISVVCNSEEATLTVMLSELAPLNADSVDIEFRAGKQKPQTGKWKCGTGEDGSVLVVPDELIAPILRAGRLAVRVKGHTRVFTWKNGDKVYAVMSECAGLAR